MKAYGLKEQSRHYRKKFSKAYWVLYDEGCTFLPEILDSAQEAFPHLWVNGEKYVFSNEVIDCGKWMVNTFEQLRINLPSFKIWFEKASKLESIKQCKSLLIETLYEFDRIWTEYEKNYVMELMVIEKDSWRHVVEAINLEKQLKCSEVLNCSLNE